MLGVLKKYNISNIHDCLFFDYGEGR